MFLDVSVVVPTYNRADGLPALLDRLLDQESEDVRYDVLDRRQQLDRSDAERSATSDSRGTRAGRSVMRSNRAKVCPTLVTQESS